MRLFNLIFGLFLTSSVAPAEIMIKAISGADTIHVTDNFLTINVSLSRTGKINFQLLSMDSVGQTRMNIFRDQVLKDVTLVHSEVASSINQVVGFSVFAEDLCIGATGIGCGDWTVGVKSKFRIGVDSNGDKLLRDADTYKEITVQFVD